MRLERAISRVHREAPHIQFFVEYVPYVTETRVPQGGMPMERYLEAVYGEVSKRWIADIRRNARADGIPFNVPAFAINQMPALIAIEWTRRHCPARQHALVKEIMTSYYRDGLNISEPSVVLSIATRLRLPSESLLMQTDIKDQTIIDLSHRVRELEPCITVVPYVVFIDPSGRGPRDDENELDLVEPTADHDQESSRSSRRGHRVFSSLPTSDSEEEERDEDDCTPPPPCPSPPDVVIASYSGASDIDRIHQCLVRGLRAFAVL